MPGVSPFPAGAFGEIVVTDFQNEAAIADFDPGLELRLISRRSSVALSRAPSRSGLVRTRPPRPRRSGEKRGSRPRPSDLPHRLGPPRRAGSARLFRQDSVPVDSPFNRPGRALSSSGAGRWPSISSSISGATGEHPLSTDVSAKTAITSISINPPTSLSPSSRRPPSPAYSRPSSARRRPNSGPFSGADRGPPKRDKMHRLPHPPGPRRGPFWGRFSGPFSASAGPVRGLRTAPSGPLLEHPVFP